MKIINQNLKKGEIKVQIDNLDDLWYLSHIIEPGDIIKGQTLRKIKIGDKEQRRTEVVKKKVFVAINAEKTEFKDDTLRVSGKIEQGPDDVPKGSYHTFNFEEGTVAVIVKKEWLKYQLDKLKEAAAFKQPSILICILDREDAIFALSKRQGYIILSSIQGEVQKKEERVVAKGSFYEDIIKSLKEYSSRYKTENIIVASPAFWKEELMNLIKDNSLKQKITMATCSSVGKNAINEILRRPETKEVLKKDRVAKETNLVEDLLTEISKQELGAYGIREVKKAAEAGAVKILLITDSLINKKREQGKYDVLDNAMKTVDATKGEIHIISSEFEGGKKLDGLGGIGAILRYKMNY
ncbi:mRNA surveillance protein pelota [Candidatus Woesearchaeota archaeon]|nr:mRNA surveillance protein pelota [Candidatus Woesearchaeota archaeon]